MFLLKFINDAIKDVQITKNVPVDKKIEDKNISREIISEPKEAPKEIKEEAKELKPIEEEKEEEVSQKIVEKHELISNGLVPIILNLDEVLNIRINNTMATADKNLLKTEAKNFELLKDFSFDQEIGYLVNSILDSKLRAVGPNDLIISYDSDASVDQNLMNLVRLNEVYNKITNSNKNIAIISDKRWDSLKEEYIEKLKNNEKYEVLEEPDLLLEEMKENDIISSSAISLFGEDIVEIE